MLPTIDEQERLVQNAERMLLALVRRHFGASDNLDLDANSFVLMVQTLLPRMRDTPASAKAQYHDAYAGGLLVHTVNVMLTALRIADALCSNRDEDDNRQLHRSLVKTAFLHDIGKLGDLQTPYYTVQDNEWRRERLGETYTIERDNDRLCYLPVPLRSIWLAHQHGVALTDVEVQAIAASDGPESPIGKTIPAFTERSVSMILHFADKWCACRNGPC